MRVKEVSYGRKFAGNNDEPRSHIGQYENEDISIVIEGTEEHEGPQVLFEQAMETVHSLHDQAAEFREHGEKRSRIAFLKKELDRLENNGDE